MRSLLLCLLAVLARADTITEIAIVGVKKLDPLRRFRPFAAWVASATRIPQSALAIDGKTSRRAGLNSKGRAAIHMVSPLAARQPVVLGQVKATERSNEVIATRKLLELRAVDRAIVTIDAMGRQREIARKVIDKNRPDNTGVGKTVDRRGSRRTSRSAGDEGGFTLLEVLVALVIALIALAVFYRGTIEGLLETRQAERTNEAVARARSRMAALCHGTRLIPGEQSGDDGSGYTWHTRINLAASEPFPPAFGGSSARAELFAVRVMLSWPGTIAAHEVALETRCLTTGPADQP